VERTNGLVMRIGREAVACCRVILFVVLIPVLASTQISPGPLSRAHQEVEGATNCTRCHAVKSSTPDFRCLDCHREIAVRLQQRRGLHASFVAPGAPSNSCVKCHSDHNGENFQMVRWEPKTLDHSKTGYKLEGKHAALACNRCHNREKIAPAERPAILTKDLNRSYIGLSQSCTSCHEDKHRGKLGSRCETCHNSVDWKVNKIFDHSKTKYPLTGGHVAVNCQKCHAQAADGMPRYIGLKFGRCADCHTDPHHGAFKQSCEECHTTAGWKKTSSLVAKFDHSSTKYPLEGKHAQVNCETCHHGSDFKKPIAFKFCADCHNPDPHNGQFAKRTDQGACESCHSVNDFKPAKYGLAEHNKSAFPLREKHADILCAKCHVPAGKATVYKVKFGLCLDCHKDVHAGQFANAPYFDRCEQCHNETTFHKTAMTLARHQKIDFKLTGGHVAVACIDCHQPIGNKGPARYHFEDLSCATCHEDPHRHQFAERMAKGRGQDTGCVVCHSTKEWKDISIFDHSSTAFALKGAHRAVACDGCHHPPNMERTLKNVDYRLAPAKCEECHENIHGPQFAQKGSGATVCSDCHTDVKWNPTTFDHEKTSFSLRDAHENVRCKSCHANFQDVNGKSVLFYKPTPAACAACHGTNLENAVARNARP